MSYSITDECVIEEYLNNWFNFEELSQYLCISTEKVANAINNIQDKRLAYKIRNHYEFMQMYNNPTINITDDYNDIIEIADYIINNHASIRNTAQYFKIGKTTVYDKIHEKLPYIDIIRYKKVFDILVENKSFDTNKKEIIEQVLNCYELLKSGLSSQEICNKLSIGRNVLQRNLTTRLNKIDSTKALEVKAILKENQLSGLTPWGKK